MQRVDVWLQEWAEQAIFEALWKSDLSGINVVERLLRDPGRATGNSGHKVLWWPKNHRISKVSKAMHQVEPIDRIILMIDYGFIPKDEKTKFTLNDLVKNSSLTMGDVRARKRNARQKINNLTNWRNK